ncbi:MAG: NADP-dependent oxidoreductase [Rhodospirillales bacterium]|jgi:NADPH:quinone reductase-like Zn-dependent oxidoreductase|nr:NADP-dependent oxidoreductase [Rhodospirillales bacterium]
MKATFFEKHGGPEVMKFGEVPDAIAAADEVLVDIHAASVNGADWKVRTGRNNQITNFPYVLGRDFSGVVTNVGDNVDDLKIGDAVFGVCDVGQEGAYAEKIAIKAAIVAKKPERVSHIDIAALSLIGLTAVVSIEDTLKLKAGEKVLIQGGAGGVAGFAIQLAKHIGAHVITTTSAANQDYVRGLGADEIIDYNAVDFTEVVSDCDAVFDTVGGEVAERSFSVLKWGGRAAFIASGAKAPEPPRSDLTSLRPRVGRDRPHLERIVELLEAGAVSAPEITLFSLSEAIQAQTVSEARHLRGKLVFNVR